MICERPYLSAGADIEPDEVCFACDGRGFKRWFNPVAGWAHEECKPCGGKTTAGVFVVQVKTERFKYELTFHTHSYAAAVLRADLRARALGRTGGMCLSAPAVAVNVVYKTRQARDEVVHVERVADRLPAAA